MQWSWSMVRLTVVTVALYMSSCFMFYHRVLLNNLQYPIQSSMINATFNQTKETTWTMPLLVSSVNIGAVLGYLLNLFLCDRIGRRAFALCICVAQLAALAVLSYSIVTGSLMLMTVSRLVTGAINSLASVNNVVMVAECAPTSHRGAFCAAATVFYSLGEMLANTLAHPLVFGTVSLWPLAMLVGYVPIALALPIMLWAHDSPRYIYLVSGHEHKASQALLFYQGAEKLTEALEDLENERQKQNSFATAGNISYGTLFRDPRIRRGLTVVVLLGARGQLVGGTVMTQFSNFLLQFMGYSFSAAANAVTIGSMLISASTVLCPVIVHYFSRRQLALHTTVFCLGVMLLLGLLSIAQQKSAIRAELALALILSHLAVHNLMSSSSTPLRVELLAQGARTKGNLVSKLCSSVLSALTALFVPMSVDLTKGVLWPISVLCALTGLSLVYLWKNLPDTSGKTFQQIQDAMDKNANSNVSAMNATATSSTPAPNSQL